MVKALLFIDSELHWCVGTGASGAYALAPNSSLGVPPKAIGAYALALGSVRTGSRNGLLGFACNLLIPLALFSHFRSELCLLKPETLERTHQGIVRNGKRFKTSKLKSFLSYVHDTYKMDNSPLKFEAPEASQEPKLYVYTHMYNLEYLPFKPLLQKHKTRPKSYV
ncbi:hypothetical protein PIB30_089669 [Stylosanthes scabra]|uniref:Uncharacterized protein n=1 Tax=Stylosanthes scabra TaxID=79078 RepID=A0ABU6SUR3_9FABA|nr:hypothetical protein [Stylosanthes scabra]